MNTVCHIVGAGDITASDLAKISKNDYIIAADGGFASLKKFGITPNLCIGDFDSLGYVPADCEVLTLPVEKDETDTGAAALEAASRGFSDIRFYGVLGGKRFSHSLAAVQTLCRLREKGIRCRIISGSCTVIPTCNETVSFPKECQGNISVFAISDSIIVSISGLKYELKNHQLRNTFPLGVSNSFSGFPAAITVSGGHAIIILED